MGIANLGESLLGDIRKRNEEQAKRQEKIARNTALGKLAVKGGLAIGNKLLEEQANNFFQNEQMLAATATQNKAMTNAQQLMSIQKQAEAQGMSVKDYKFSQVRPVFEARLKEKLPAEVIGEAGGFDALVTQEAQKYVSEWEKKYNEALSLAGNVGTKQDFEGMLKLNANKVVSDDVGSWATKNFMRMFSGKSNDDIQKEAVLAIADNEMVDNAEKLNIFMEEFSRTNNVNEAKNFADIVIPDEMVKGQTRTTENEKIINSGGRAVVLTEVVTENPTTGEKTTKYKKNDKGVPDVTILNPQNVEEVDQKVAKSLMSTFNFGTNARDELTTSAYKDFVRKAKEEGLNVVAPKTAQEYYALSEIYSDFITDSNNLADRARESQILAMQEILLGDGLELKAFIAQMTEKPEEREQILQDIMLRLDDIMKKSREMYEDDDSLDFTQF